MQHLQLQKYGEASHWDFCLCVFALNLHQLDVAPFEKGLQQSRCFPHKSENKKMQRSCYVKD